MNHNHLTEQIEYAADLIIKGEIVAFPTETVYGIGADVSQVNAIEKIYSIKKRPQNNPLIVHISNLKQLKDLVSHYGEKEKLLMDKFWPGPLTILFKKHKSVPDIVTAGSEYVAIRMPSNQIALDLITKSNTPIVAPSANPSGKPSSTHHKHVKYYFENNLFCIEGGKTNIGLESTVISLNEVKPSILRLGMITQSDLEQVLGEEFIVENKSSKKVLSPGMLYKHYAPNAELKIIDKFEDFIPEIYKLDLQNKKIGILASVQTIKILNLSEDIIVKSLGNKDNLLEISNNLFEKLLEFDSSNVDIILTERFEGNGLDKAIMDKLERATQR